VSDRHASPAGSVFDQVDGWLDRVQIVDANDDEVAGFLDTLDLRGPQEREMRRYLMTRKLGGVEFLGRVSDDERDALFKTADVYCSPATGRESFGIVLLEAMAAGTAIVCSDIHGYKGVVRRGREALLVPPGRPKAIAGALATLLANDEMREAMGRSGLERAQEYSWERVTAKVEDYYGFVIRRLASQGQLPSGFHAPIPPSPRVPLVAA